MLAPIAIGRDLPIDAPTESPRARPPLAPHFRRLCLSNRRNRDEP